MSLGCHTNTGTVQNNSGQPPRCSGSNSSARRMSHFERDHSEATPPLRLPQIHVPSHFEFQHRQNPSPLSTCPSLHQHHQRKHDMPSTDSILRKFFAKGDDMSEPITDSRHYRTPSSPGNSSDRLFSNEVITRRAHGNHIHPYNISHFQQSFQPDVAPSKDNGRVPLEAGRVSPPSTSVSNNASEYTPENDRVWENARQSRSSFSFNSDSLATLPSIGGSETVGPIQGELYRCSDCNRKCKSKASYLKHRSMMCTHRLGPLTLECRYCKRHYTYAGYLQRHELECARTNTP